VVAYGISINLVEVTWKSKIKAQFPNPNDYSSFMGDFSTATGAVTFTMMILSRYIFRYFGWGTAALITPTVLLITGILFFGLVLFSDPLTPTLKAMGLTPLMAAVLVGAAQNVFSKSAKYSLFDPCKEMAVSGGGGAWRGAVSACVVPDLRLLLLRPAVPQRMQQNFQPPVPLTHNPHTHTHTHTHTPTVYPPGRGGAHQGQGSHRRDLQPPGQVRWRPDPAGARLVWGLVLWAGLARG